MSFRPRVLIADDHKLVADLCRRLLEPQFDVVSIVTNGPDLVNTALELRPDVILADIAMSVLNGLDAAAKVRSVLGRVKIIHLTMISDPQVAMYAIAEGASGFLLKSCAASELVLAVRTVLSGGRYISPLIKEKVAQLRWEGIHPSPEADRLTQRQREVLRLLTEGKHMKEVGEILGMTARTVAYHKYRIMAALGVNSNADLVKYALRTRMVAA